MLSACVPMTVDGCGDTRRELINQSRSAGVVRSAGRLRKRIPCRTLTRAMGPQKLERPGSRGRPVVLVGPSR
jgi:hypothetical protein